MWDHECGVFLLSRFCIYWSAQCEHIKFYKCKSKTMNVVYFYWVDFAFIDVISVEIWNNPSVMCSITMNMIRCTFSYDSGMHSHFKNTAIKGTVLCIWDVVFQCQWFFNLNRSIVGPFFSVTELFFF